MFYMSNLETLSLIENLHHFHLSTHFKPGYLSFDIHDKVYLIRSSQAFSDPKAQVPSSQDSLAVDLQETGSAT